MLVHRLGPPAAAVEHERGEAAHEALAAQQQLGRKAEIADTDPFERAHGLARKVGEVGDVGHFRIDQRPVNAQDLFLVAVWPRSEEHTSELQSLMRISYAVFCLKKKTH